MFKDPFAANGAALQQIQLVSEETLHRCNFSFVHVLGANGQKVWALIFDVPLGLGFARRITIPFDSGSIEKFESQLRAWRAGIELA